MCFLEGLCTAGVQRKSRLLRERVVVTEQANRPLVLNLLPAVVADEHSSLTRPILPELNHADPHHRNRGLTGRRKRSVRQRVARGSRVEERYDSILRAVWNGHGINEPETAGLNVLPGGTSTISACALRFLPTRGSARRTCQPARNSGAISGCSDSDSPLRMSTRRSFVLSAAGNAPGRGGRIGAGVVRLDDPVLASRLFMIPNTLEPAVTASIIRWPTHKFSASEERYQHSRPSQNPLNSRGGWTSAEATLIVRKDRSVGTM